MVLQSDRTTLGTRVYESMLDLLPNVDNPTPLVKLNRVTPYEHTEVYVKLEWYNPFGSVKDRVAASMITEAQIDGTISGGQRLVEPTSGNTGLGLTMLSNAHGYALTTPLSNAIPEEKRNLLRFFGAEVEELNDDLCPAPGAPEGAIARANEIAGEPDFHMLNQYGNEANPMAHYRSTGPEIWNQTEGRITHFVAGLGTCGTITGTGSFLKERRPSIEVIGVHPSEGHDIPGVRSIRQLRQTRFFDPGSYDGVVEIDNDTAYRLCARLNREESIPAGPSSGMALAGAFLTVPDVPGAKVVVIFPDSSLKYASSMKRHVPGVSGAAPAPTVKSRREEFLDAMVENTRVNPDLTIDIDRAIELIGAGAFVLDVRSEDTFAIAHVPGAQNTPLLDLPERVDDLPSDRNAPVLTICQRGNLSLSAVLFLKSLGYTNVRSVDGGTNAWIDEGHQTNSV
ncbi:MAG TPA: pyridoxal-phosphate dependent enzyme [Acidimicrobiia bacterium]|nr:pyridoxal-phosphate dependent enzyme [Acidimicrobiia bacterium]